MALDNILNTLYITELTYKIFKCLIKNNTELLIYDG